MAVSRMKFIAILLVLAMDSPNWIVPPMKRG